jgi:chromosome segregation ATPase
LKKEIRHFRADILEAKSEIEKLRTSATAANELQDSTMNELIEYKGKSEMLTTSLEQCRKDSTKLQKILEGENTTLTFRLTKCMKENDANHFTISRLQSKLTSMEKDLETTKLGLETETNWREVLQNQLHENRLKYSQERSMRGEFERMNMQMRHSRLLDDVELENRRKLCYRKLNNVSNIMGSETKRLREFSSLLPHSVDLGNQELPTGKGFDWLFSDNALTRLMPSPGTESSKKSKEKKPKKEEKKPVRTELPLPGRQTPKEKFGKLSTIEDD